MKTILPFRLKNKNTYLFINKGDFKFVMLVNPSLIPHLSEKKMKTNKGKNDYYYKKAEYLKSHLPKLDNLYFGRIHPEQVSIMLSLLRTEKSNV